jgi:predicted Zn-dependent protease
MKIKFLVSGLITTAILALTACSTNPVSGKKDFSLISKDQELALGAQGHKSVLKQYKRYNNPSLQSYVSNIGKALASKSHRSNINYTFPVLDDPSVNAFALPGGYIYVTTGILSYLNSEGELAGVLGHEIGHVTARHGAQQQSMGIAGAILTGIIASKTGKDTKSLNQLSTALIKGYGREHELQADKLGAEYLARSGYATKNMLDVIGVLKAQEQYSKFLAKKEGRQAPSYHGVFSSHPTNDRRLQNVIAQADKIKSAGTKPDNHDGYLQRINGLKYRIDKKHTGRIAIGRASTPGLTYAQLARRSKVGEQRLRLLNGMFPKGEPVQGRMVKIIK